MYKQSRDGKKKIGNVISDSAKSVGKKANEVAVATKDTAVKSKQAVFNAIDVNGDGQIDIEDVIILGLKTPGVNINREKFFRKEFMKNYPEDVIKDAIQYNPAHANIPTETVDRIADEVIKFERNCVSGISAALGAPGGAAIAATIPADIAQYYGYMLRAAQKLMYLYGFPEIDIKEKGSKFDTETLNILIICLGAMYGAAGANNAIKAMARSLAKGVEKKLLKTALTKGTFYPIVKSVAKWFSVKMTKEVFAGFFKKAIPVVGGVIGGGLTYVTFKPCCDRLKDSLKDTMLSNPNHKTTKEEDELIVDVEVREVKDVAMDGLGIWDKVKEHEGETFYLKNGQPLIYKVEGNCISHNRTKVKINKSSFEKAVQINPQSTTELQKKVTGPAYVFAIITDERMK